MNFSLLVSLIGFFSGTFCIPKFFDVQLDITNSTDSSTGRINGYVLTALYFNKDYQIWQRWWDLIIFSIIPFTVLAMGNLGIIMSLKRSTRDIHALTRSQSGKNEKKSTAKILLTVVLMFLLCHVFRLGFNIYFIINPYMEEQANYCYSIKRFPYPRFWYLMEYLQQLLLVLNSSINFFIYCCVGKDFRLELKNMLFKKAAVRPELYFDNGRWIVIIFF